MIFVLHYVLDKKTAARHVKQSLRRNAPFKAFAVNMNDIITRLTDLEVLLTERPVKLRRVENEIRRGVNEVRIVESADNFFTTVFYDHNERHRDFLRCYLIIYPREVFGTLIYCLTLVKTVRLGLLKLNVTRPRFH